MHLSLTMYTDIASLIVALPAIISLSFRRVDPEDVAQFFPYPKVLEGLFKLASNLFGITIKVGANLYSVHQRAYQSINRSIDRCEKGSINQSSTDTLTVVTGCCTRVA